MIRKLRIKIIVFSFLSVCVVFVVGLAVLLGVGYGRLNDERIARLNSTLQIENWDTGNWDTVDTHSIGGIVLAEYDVSTEQTLLHKRGDGVVRTDEYILEAIPHIVKRHHDSGTYGIKLVYSRSLQGDVMRIAVYDRDYNTEKEVKYTIYVVVALLLGSVCYVVICYFLSRMALRPVETTWKRQKQFVADASHELKTPLAVIGANMDVLCEHSDETVESQMRWIESTRFETDRMTGLVKDLLFLAKNDEGLKEDLDSVDISDCVQSVVLAQEVLLYERGKTFSYEIAPHLKVLGNDGQLKQLVTILLDNAGKYSVNEGNVRLDLSVVQNIAGRFAELKVSNDCDELTEEQTSHLFDRFYTVDSSRDKTHTGNGLGLSIAQTICENHQGQISAAYENGRISFTAQIPLYKPPVLLVKPASGKTK